MLATIRTTVLFSGLLSRNVKVKIYKIITLTVALYGCETWSLTLRKEHRIRVFEKRVLRRIFGPKWDEVTQENFHNEDFIFCTNLQILLGR
jgi:fumarate reductase subunit C